MQPYRDDIKALIKHLETDAVQGLSKRRASELLARYGKNKLEAKSSRRWWEILFSQFNNLLVLLLIVASALSFQLGSYRDGIVLAIIVVVNALIGFFQDWKSENILQSLKSLITEHANVIRDGKQIELPVDELVPGDIVAVSEGDGVAADMRLLESSSLFANEFILTGESQASEKDCRAEVNEDASIAARTNMVFMGTSIAKGHAKGLVIGTGMNTEIGKIAGKSGGIKQDVSPLQREINLVAKKLTVITLVLGAAIFVFGIFAQKEAIGTSLVFAISIAAAMVPEGLPAQISIALALGVRRLAQKKAVVKQLSSVEALGSATVIASDKTGTITKNEMSINNCLVDGLHYIISGTGYAPAGQLLDSNLNPITSSNIVSQKKLFAAGYLSSTSSVNPPDEYHSTWYGVGDPTECAFATLALKAGLKFSELEQAAPRLQLFPFDSVRKRASAVRLWEGKPVSFVKGSIESILEICNTQLVGGIVKELTEDDKESLLQQAEIFASEALRVIALGNKELQAGKGGWDISDAESDIVFLGFTTMYDPPKDEVAQAVKDALDARMRIVMITGDNEITARAIARNIGLVNADGSLPEVVNQKKLAVLGEEELKELLTHRTIIFSRVSPDEKLHIVTVLKTMDEVVAVTGDGVNDTLSLKKADIGVAMGRSGSKVAQEAAAMVLLDDNFSTIVNAVKEGRTIFNNIRKNVAATLASNTAELTCVLYGFVGVYHPHPVAILAIHILLIDLIGEMLPLLMLSFDPAYEGIMHEPPRRKGQLLNRELLKQVVASGVVRGLLAIAAFLAIYGSHAGEAMQHQTAVTGTFITIILTQFINIFCIRTKGSVFNSFLFANPYLIWGMVGSLFAMFIIIYLPFFNLYLHTGPLGVKDWMFPLSASIIYLIGFELIKWIRGHHKAPQLQMQTS